MGNEQSNDAPQCQPAPESNVPEECAVNEELHYSGIPLSILSVACRYSRWSGFTPEKHLKKILLQDPVTSTTPSLAERAAQDTSATITSADSIAAFKYCIHLVCRSFDERKNVNRRLFEQKVMRVVDANRDGGEHASADGGNRPTDKISAKLHKELENWLVHIADKTKSQELADVIVPLLEAEMAENKKNWTLKSIYRGREYFFKNKLWGKPTVLNKKEISQKLVLLVPVFSVIRMQALELTLKPGFTGPFSGGKPPDHLIRHYGQDRQARQVTANRKNRRIIMSHTLATDRSSHKSHFMTSFGDTRSILTHIGPRRLKEIARGGERDMWTRTPNSFCVGLLMLQRIPAPEKLKVLCFSVGNLTPLKEIAWERLCVQIIGASLSGYCLVIGQKIDRIGSQEDFPQMSHAAIEKANKNRHLVEEEIDEATDIVYSSFSETESDTDSEHENIGEKSGKQHKSASVARSRWNKIQMHVEEKRKTKPSASKLLDAWAKASWNALDAKQKTKSRWQMLKIGANATQTSSLSQARTKHLAKLSKAKKECAARKEKWTEEKDSVLTQLYAQLKGTNRHLPVEDIIAAFDRIEPIARALGYITIVLYESKMCGPNTDPSLRLNLPVIVNLMTKKSVPSKCLTRISHALTVHLQYFYDDALATMAIVSEDFLPADNDRKGMDVFTALQAGEIGLVTSILKTGMSIDVRQAQSSATCLQLAAQTGNMPLVFWLLVSGADSTLTNALGMSALHYACKFGNAEVVKCLLDFEVDTSCVLPSDDTSVQFVDTQNNLTGATPLHLAASAGAVDCVEALLLRFAKTNIRDCDYRTPLDCARAHGHEHVAELLIHDLIKSHHLKSKLAQTLYIPLITRKLSGWNLLRQDGVMISRRMMEEAAGGGSRNRIPIISRGRDDIEHFFETVHMFTTFKYSYDCRHGHIKDDVSVADNPVFSVCSFKALSYAAAHVSLMKGKLRKEANREDPKPLEKLQN